LSGGNRPLAEDLVQETFLRMMGKIGQYTYPRPFRAWLYTIANNLLRDHFKRAETRLTGATPAETLDQWQSDVPQPETAVQTQQITQQLINAVTTLPLHQRETIILRYAEGLSLQEISIILQIPVGTVKSRLSLGLKRMKEGLSDED
ncbi:MAG: RNA polymerase sigma factor, partial [Chloroflexi bacterium]|nr:RNA polymerase sigma factor [Chloroflexota bacterium]